MANSWRQPIEQLHAAPARLVLAATGGGSAVIGRLLEVPGASRTVLEASVPYANSALSAYLGAAPEHFCHERTARAMAMAAFERAKKYAPGAGPLIGVGATASLVSDRPKRGGHRAHVATQTIDQTRVTSLVLAKGARDRAGEESLTADLILAEIAQNAGLADLPPLDLREGERLQTQTAEAEAAWIELLEGARQSVDASPHGNSSRRVLFPGAFDPPHAGHAEIARAAEQMLGEPAACELSLVNVDKPPLDYLEIRRRLDALAGAPLWLTRAATFVEKSKLFPGATFIVGADTMARVAEAKYYGNDPARRDAAIDQLAERGCRFLVFGRAAGGRFLALSALNLPPRLAALCREVPERDFRRDISSTEIRRRQ